MAREALPARSRNSGTPEANGRAKVAKVEIDPIAEAVRQWKAHDFGALEHMEATTSITRIHQIVVRRIDQELHAHRLTFAQYEALVLLHFSREGSLPLGRMGHRLMVHPATITSTIDLLEEKGFVRREKHPTDRRQVLATITPGGRSVAKKATDALVAMKYGLDHMTAAEAKAISKVIRDVRGRMGDSL
jgi:DNA-binding MarR family transcriptional regulator